MKTLRTLLLLSIFSISFNLFAQTNTNIKRNLVFVEALGNGLFGSVNYERTLTKDPGLSLRLGVGFYTEDAFYLTIPTSLQYSFFLKENSYLETGFGYTWADANANDIFKKNELKDNDNLHNLFFSIGYKKYFGNDWMWKVNFSPIITNNKDVTLPWLGISFGKTF